MAQITAIASDTVANTYNFDLGIGETMQVLTNHGGGETINIKQKMGATYETIQALSKKAEITGPGQYQVDKPITAAAAAVYVERF